MRRLNFTRKELGRIVKACALLQIDDCTPPYLQEFIATRLADSDAVLSAKVWRLTSEEMDDLCEHIKENPAPVW